MPRMKFRIPPISIALVVTLVLGGLSSDDACAQKELTKIKIGYAAPTVDNVLIAIADKEGLFEKFGLKAELIGMRGGVQVLQGLVGGTTDFGQGGGPESVQAIASGMDAVIIAGLIPRIHYLLVTRPEIATPADLIGKKIAVASLNGDGNDCDAPGPGSSRSGSEPHYFFSCGSSAGPSFGGRFWKYGCDDCSTREHSCREESGAKDPKRSVGNP